MRDPEFPLIPPNESRFNFLRQRRRSRVPVVITIVGIALIAGGMVWYWQRHRPPEEATGVAPAAIEQTLPAPAPDVPPLALPELDASDAFVRDLVAELSSHPRLAAWLANDALVHRFVAGTANIANGTSPAPNVPFLAPGAAFRVAQSGGRMFIDPASYRRYDLLAATFVSLDTEGVARLYRQLHPLLREAHGELGLPAPSFDAVLTDAVDNVLAVEVPEGPVEIVPATTGTGFEFADAGLERRSAAAKHLLRMGPENARRVQAKLREIAGALGIPLAEASR
jgi:hypothetical protein